MKRLHGWLVVALVLFCVAGQAAEVDALTAKFEAARDRALKPFQEKLVELDFSYSDQLDQLARQLQSAGNLDGLVEAKKEKELLTTTGSIGVSESAILGDLRQAYTMRETAIESEIAAKTEELNLIYVGELKRLQQELTIAGKIEEALKAKGIADALAKPQEAAPASAPVASAPSESPWAVPAVTPAVLVGGTFLEPVVFPPGRHRLREQVQIGARDPVKQGKVYLTEGTELSCAGDGEIFISAGQGYAFKTLFTTARIEGGLAGDWEFVSCVFDRTPLRKGDGWRGRPHASQWKFENCKISGEFFDRWSTKDVGYQIENSTFERVKFLDLEYHEAADGVAQKEWLTMRNCRFVNCDIPLSVLITTINCVFENCTFRDDENTPSFSGTIHVKLYTKDCNSRLRDIPDKVTLEIKEAAEFTGEAGASL